MSFNINANQAAQGANYAGRAMNAFQTAVNIDNQQPQPEGTTFWFRWLIRVVAVVTGILAMISGLFAAIGFSLFCTVAGILMMCLGLAVMMFEVPICCQFIRFTQPAAEFSQQRPPWQKAVLYSVPALVPLLFCQSVGIVFAFICILVNGAIQFMLAVGKKAPLQEMLQRAGAGFQNRGQLVPDGPPVNAPMNPPMNPPAGSAEKGFNFTPLS